MIMRSLKIGSAISSVPYEKYPLYRWFCYKSLTGIRPVPKKSVGYDEVSTIQDVRYEEVRLYHDFVGIQNSIFYAINTYKI